MRFVFITGAGRCGTTLMRGLLDGHPGYHVLPDEFSGFHRFFLEESGYSARLRLEPDARRLFRLVASFFQATGNETEVAEKLDAAQRQSSARGQTDVTAQEFAELIAYALFPEQRDVMVIDATSEDFSGLLSEFPDSRVVHMVRHPMEQLNSHYRFRFRDPNSFGGTYPGNWELGATFRRLYRAFAEAERHQNNPRVRIVRLEELQADPQGTMAQVVRFIGFEPHEANRVITKGGKAFDAGSTQKAARDVFRSESDWSCLTPDDLYHLGLINAARIWYDVPNYPPVFNRFSTFLWRQLGFTGRNRPRLRLGVQAVKVAIVAATQYLNDRAAKHYFRLYLEQGKPLRMPEQT